MTLADIRSNVELLRARNQRRTHDHCHHEGRDVPAREHRRRAASSRAMAKSTEMAVDRGLQRAFVMTAGLSAADGPDLEREASIRGVSTDPIAQFIAEVEEAAEAWDSGAPSLADHRSSRDRP